MPFYSHVNYSVTKIVMQIRIIYKKFYSHVNYSVTKIYLPFDGLRPGFTVT